MKKSILRLLCFAVCLTTVMTLTLSCKKEENETVETCETVTTDEEYLSDISDPQRAALEEYFNDRVKQEEKDNENFFSIYKIAPYTELMVYGAEQDGKSIRIYLRALCHDFLILNGEPFSDCPYLPETSVHYAITADTSNYEFNITDIEKPEDGDTYEDTLKVIFPEEIYAELSDNDTEVLRERMYKHVSEYYGCEINEDEPLLNLDGGEYSIIDRETNKESEKFDYSGEQRENWFDSLINCSERHHFRAEYSDDYSFLSGYYVPYIMVGGAGSKKLNGEIKDYIDTNIKPSFDEIVGGGRDFVIYSNYKCCYKNDILTVEVSFLRADYGTDMHEVINKAFFYRLSDDSVLTADEVCAIEGFDKQALFDDFKKSISTDEDMLFYFLPSDFTSPEQFEEIYQITDESVRIIVKDRDDLLYTDGKFSVCTHTER